MRYSAELMLTAVLLGLYVWDASLLLDPNEAVLSATGAGAWQAGFAWRHGAMFGKHICLASLLFPARPLFKLAWDYVSPGQPGTGSWTDYSRHLRPFRLPVASLMVVLLLVLPAALTKRMDDAAILLILAVVYVHLIAIAALLFRHRVALGLPRGLVAGLVFDFLLCPPFALNVVRRLTLAHRVREDFVAACTRLLSAGQLVQVQREIMLRLDDEIVAEATDSPRMPALLQRRSELARMTF